MNSNEITWGTIDGLRLNTDDSISFTYKNYRGETANRTARIIGFFTGSNEYHPEIQPLLRAVDLERNVERIFAVRDISKLSLNKPLIV